MELSLLFPIVLIISVAIIETAATEPSWDSIVLQYPDPLHDVVNDDSASRSLLFDAVDDVQFELFTTKNLGEPSLLVLGNNASIENSNFDPKNPTRIFVHGWMSNGGLTFPFVDAYLVKGKHKVNLIALNWGKGAMAPYFISRNRVDTVGLHLADFINFLVDNHQLNLKDLHLVGHSLGAHVCGIAGKNMNRGKIAKIVGLDPASRYFIIDHTEHRLHANDADYVEVIHTSRLGIFDPIGTANFYPNGGKSQPGCFWSSCHHSRAWEYFLESLHGPPFLAFECKSFEDLANKNCALKNDIVRMGGEPGNKFLKGIYYLETESRSKYSQGEQGLFRTVMNAKIIVNRSHYTH